MLTHARAWHNRIHFPSSGSAPLGFGAEYWDSNPEHYEGWQQLRDRFYQLSRKLGRRQLSYHLTSTLLDDVVVAAGGIERAVAALRRNAQELSDYAEQRQLRAKDGVPTGLALVAAIHAWYAFTDDAPPSCRRHSDHPSNRGAGRR